MTTENTTLELDGIEYSRQDYLNFTQARRIRFAQAIESATGTPEDLAKLDPDRQANYLAALNAIDKQVIDMMKLEQDKESNDAQNNMIAELITKRAVDRNIQRSRESQGIMPDPTLLPSRTLIAGETDIGDRIEDYRQFRSRTGQEDHQGPDFQTIDESV